MDSFIAAAALVVGTAGLAVSLTVLGYAIRIDRRARERSHVDWQVDRTGPGEFTLTNIGSDTAYEVSVEAWTEHELVKASATKVERGGTITVTLPHRAANGPAAVELMTDVMPTPPPNDAFGMALRRQSEDIRRAQIESQVSVEVVWRSRRGVWADQHMKTG